MRTYESLDFYLDTAKRAIGRWGHINMLKSEDDISHVAYMIMLADQKFDGRGNISGFRMQYAKWGILKLIYKFKKRIAKQPYSLDNDSDEKLNLYGRISDGSLPVDVQFDLNELTQTVSDSTLRDREKNSIIRYYIYGDTLEEIGNREGITREAIRQNIERGLEKLREIYNS